jgi:hypothetical protein
LLRLGHDAYSCDLLPTSGAHPDRHIVGDVLNLLQTQTWDAVIAFPPCTDLAVSGARYFAAKRADGRQARSVEFFLTFTRLRCPWAIENPVGIMSGLYRRPDQIIQPFQFGSPESKKTCLWLHDLPLLTPTNILPLPESGHWENQTASGQNRLPPSPERAKLRSKTYPGIARAMAEQWFGRSK